MKKILFLTLSCFLFFPLVPCLLALDIPEPGASYAYPLPAKVGGTVSLVYTMAGPGSVRILVYNEAGDKVMDFSDLKPAGLQSSLVGLCCLPPGVYLYITFLNYDSGKSEKLRPAKFVVSAS